jgi:hypothetical protein
MRCPNCKNSQTEVFRVRSLRSKTYRYRRCQFCKARFWTQERPVRWEGIDRNGLVRPRIEEGGAVIGCRPFEEIARWRPVKWISN